MATIAVARGGRFPDRSRRHGDARGASAGRRPGRERGDGAGVGRELPRRQPPAAAARALAPARDLRLRAPRRRARRQRAGRPPGRARWLEAELDRAFAGRAEHPLCRRLQATMRECALPREPFVRLIEANRHDQRVSRYETWEQLRRLLHAVGRPGRRARARRVRRCHARADRAVGLDLHGAAAGRALPGRRRGPARAAASTCRPRTSALRLRARRTSRRGHAGPRCARCSPSRSRARARCCGEGAPLVDQLQGRAAPRGRGVPRRRARRARRDRARGLRRAGRSAALRERPAPRALAAVLAEGRGRGG